jgi:tetratricopeptide (TPR) repeat protein
MAATRLIPSLVLLFAACLLNANAAEPWDGPFSSDISGLVRSAAQLTAPEGQKAQVLLEEYLISVRPDGRVSSKFRKVYRILGEEAVEDWSSVEESYQPWREQKPEIRARVITRAGAVHMLDAKTIADSPMAEFDSSMYSDARIVRAPLPAIEPGAVVEYEVTTDSGPGFAGAGVVRRIQVVDNVPLERFHIVIEVPAGASLHTVYRQIPDAAVQKTVSKKGTHIECELGPFKPRNSFESSLPPDVSPFPYIAFSTASDWDTLAAQYSEIVDRQIQSADVGSLVEGADRNAAPLAIAARLATLLHRSVRYTGVEFGQAAVVPATPSEVQQRRFGDCKDKSALLVAMLRAAGLQANVALLRSGSGLDVDPNVPGLDLFDHAIVYVGGSKPLWIDATANELRVGILPSGDQGRFALIARKGTSGLVKIPEQTDSLDRREYTVQFKDFGPGSITEVMESNGPSEAYLRRAYATSDNAKTALERYVKSAYVAKRLGNYELAGKDDLSQPVRVTVEAVETPQVITTVESANVLLGASLVISTLPYELQAATNRTDSKEPVPARSNDFYFGQAGVTERAFKLYPPALYKLGSLPDSKQMNLGPLRLSQTYKTDANGVVEADFRLEVPKRRISAAEYEAVRAALQKYSSQLSERISFVPETAELLATGQTSKALSLMRESVTDHDEDASAHIRQSRVLISVGLGLPARMEAERATALDPNSSQAWQTLAWAWQNDTFGRLRQGDWNRSEALKALRKAVELDPDDAIAKADLAILLDYNDRGERYGIGNNEAEAIPIYRELLKKQANVVLESNLTATLFYNGQWEEASAESRKCLDDQRILFQALIQALQRGAGPAIVALQAEVVDPTARAQFLASAAFSLIHLRRYPDALTFFQAAARATTIPQSAALLQLVSGMKRSEDVVFPDTDPRSVEQKVFLLVLNDEKPSREKLAELLTFVPKTGEWGEEIASARKAAFSGFQQLVQFGFTRENFLDMTLSNLKLNKEGDDTHGYRISAEVMGGAIPTMFVVREGVAYKIIGSTDSMEEIGRRVLDLLKKNNLEGAQWWLDHSIPSIPYGSDGWLPAARGLWSGTIAATRGPSAARVAAASLIGRYEGAADAVAILKEAYPKAANAVERAQIDQALCDTYAKGKKWEDMAVIARRLMTSEIFNSAGFQFLMRALEEQKDWKALENAALEQTKTKVPQRDAWKYVAIARIASGNGTGAAEAIEKFKPSAVGAEAVELQAWNEIRQKRVSQELLDTVKKTDGRVQVHNPYLVALVELQLKKTEDAQQSLKEAVQTTDAAGMDARGWVIYGHLCEQYGFPDAAKKAWASARSAKAPSREAQWALATVESLAR